MDNVTKIKPDFERIIKQKWATEKNTERTTAPTLKVGFHASQTVLW
jgi:hypothetical protein